jgi:hypothetical protein
MLRAQHQRGQRDALAKFGFYSNLTEDEVKEIERQHHHGMTAHQLGAAIVGGKILAHNALTRHGQKLAPIRWLGKQFAGMGYRAGEQGRPMLPRAVREIGALALDPHMVSAYEGGHAAGRAGGVIPQAVHGARDFISDPRVQEALRDRPHLADVANFLQGVPTESKGFANVVDHMHSPGMAASKAVEGLGGLGGRALGGLKSVFSKGHVP